MSSFKPLGDNVLVKLTQAESTTKTGIVLPGSSKKQSNTGEVISIGSGTLVKEGTKFPIEVQPGERVLFKEGAGVTLDIDDEEFVVLREYDILGII